MLKKTAIPKVTTWGRVYPSILFHLSVFRTVQTLGGHSSSTQKGTGQTSANWGFLGGKKHKKKFSINKQSAVTRGRGGNFYICAWPCCIYISRSSFLKGQNIERGIFKSSMQSHLLTFASQNLLLIAPKNSMSCLCLILEWTDCTCVKEIVQRL